MNSIFIPDHEVFFSIDVNTPCFYVGSPKFKKTNLEEYKKAQRTWANFCQIIKK